MIPLLTYLYFEHSTMEFRKELIIRPFKHKIDFTDKILLIGSCFSDNLGEKLRHFKFDVRINPNGTLFNPVSISKALSSYIACKSYNPDDLFFHDDLWKSWDHHSQFSHREQNEILRTINTSIQETHHLLKRSSWLIITLGSAWVYEKENGSVVANCHKVPTDKFRKRLLTALETKAMLADCIHELTSFNPSIRILFTISPVRHLRDGFIENNRSKAVLIQAVHDLLEEKNNIMYFPAYEFIIDDLRDYRFYAEDMVHPNYMATDYVWEKFRWSCINDRSLFYFKDINLINAAKAHKPFQPDTAAHQQFREKKYNLVKKLQAELPELNWESDLEFFKD